MIITYLTAAIIPEGYEDQAKQPIGTGPLSLIVIDTTTRQNGPL